MLIKESLFVSDLHLARDRPAEKERFLTLLSEFAGHDCEVFILGDLFEYWVGDDDIDDPFNASVVAALSGLHKTGVALYFMHGNRDFLIGERFAEEAGLTLLADPVVRSIQGEPTLLMHGDLLCTDDLAYLAFREEVRNPAWQAQFLGQPLAVRHEMARAATKESDVAKSGKSMEIMDATPQAVLDAFKKEGVKRLIHGHTHRPAIHTYKDLGAIRYVLPDWYGRGGYLLIQNGRPQLVRF